MNYSLMSHTDRAYIMSNLRKYKISYSYHTIKKMRIDGQIKSYKVPKITIEHINTLEEIFKNTPRYRESDGYDMWNVNLIRLNHFYQWKKRWKETEK